MDGIAEDVRQHGLEPPVEPEVYLPFAQAAKVAFNIVIATTGNPADLAPALRTIIRSVNREVPVFEVSTLEQPSVRFKTRRLDRNDGAARRVAPPAASETSRTSSVRSGLGAPPLYAGRPDNRLVADSLEAEWNNKLRTLSEAQQNLEHQREQDRKVLSDQQRAAILSLATDFPRLWRDPNTPDRERKRMIRLLLEDFTLVRGEKITLHIRFKGGATKTLMVPAPLNAWQQRATNPAVVKEIDRLLDHHTYQQIVSILNERGLHSGEGKSFSVRILARIQKRYGLMPRYDRLRKAGMLTVKEMAALLGITPQWVKTWNRLESTWTDSRSRLQR